MTAAVDHSLGFGGSGIPTIEPCPGSSKHARRVGLMRPHIDCPSCDASWPIVRGEGGDIPVHTKQP